MLFDRQIKFLGELEAEAFTTLREAVNLNRDIIADFVTEDQLFKRGVDGKNKALRGYARTTIRIKQRKGQPTDRTTLRDTGKFHNTLSVTGLPLELEVKGQVPYTKYLTTEGNRYGIDILRPSNANMAKFFAKYWLPLFSKRLKERFKAA